MNKKRVALCAIVAHLNDADDALFDARCEAMDAGDVEGGAKILTVEDVVIGVRREFEKLLGEVSA